MGLFRQVNSLIKSVAYTATSLVNAKMNNTKSKIKLASSLTILATNAVGLGATLLNKARKGLKKANNSKRNYSNNSYQEPSSKKSTPNYKDEPKGNQNDKNTTQYNGFFSNFNNKPKKSPSQDLEDYLLEQQELREKELKEENPSILETLDYKEKIDGMPQAFYEVKSDLMENYSEFLDKAIEYKFGKLEITLPKNKSKFEFELNTKGTIKGKDALEYYSPEERKKMVEKFHSTSGKDMILQQKILIGANGIYNERDENLLETSKNSSELLSRVSIDYGKNYIPFFNVLLTKQTKLSNEGFF